MYNSMEIESLDSSLPPRKKSNSTAQSPTRRPISRSNASSPKITGELVEANSLSNILDRVGSQDPAARSFQEVINSVRWEDTQLGPRQSWPHLLSVLVNMAVLSVFPVVLAWVSLPQCRNDLMLTDI